MKAVFNRWFDNLKEPWRLLLVILFGIVFILLISSSSVYAVALAILLFIGALYLRVKA